MNKKVISSVLAGAMALSTMGVVVSAADNKTDTGNNALTAKAGLLEAVVDADIPAELETYINPYGAQVTAQNSANVEAAVKYSDGLISPTYKIVNNSTAAGLNVTATAKITPSSTVAVNTKLLDDAKLAKATEKQVFAFLNTTTDAATTPVFADTKYVGNEHQVVFTEDGTKVANIMSLGKTATDKTGYFYIGGQCTPDPEEAWDSKDSVTLDLVLDLAPSAGAAADLSLASLTIDAPTAPAVPASIEKEFDGNKKTYTLTAKGSGTKYPQLKATAQTDATGSTASKVLVKFNGKLFSAAQTGDATKVDIAITAASVGTSGASAAVKPMTGKDFNAGDTIEFIVVNGNTNESTTYTIIFE